MKIRLCPYCDHEMTGRHRCTACNSFVWKANTVDVHLNAQSRGLGEADCSYSTGDVHGQDQPSYDRQPSYDQPSAYDSGKSSDERVFSREPEVKKKSRKWVYALTAFIIIAAGAAGLFYGLVMHDNGSVFEDEAQMAEPVDYWVEEITPEELAGFSEACTYTGHLPLDGEEICAMTQAFLTDRGYANLALDEYSFAERIMDDLEENLRYSRIVSCELDENYDQRFSIDYDAVTGQVHQIDMDLWEMETGCDYIAMVIGEAGGMTGLTGTELFDYFNRSLEDGYAMAYCGIYQISASVYDESPWHFSITASDVPYDSSMLVGSEADIPHDAVMAEGTRCNSQKHMSIMGEYARTELENFLAEQGYQGLEMVSMEDNWKENYSQLGGYTYSATSYASIYGFADRQRQQGFFVESDSYSDEVHRIFMEGYGMENLEDFIELSVLFTGFDNEAALMERCQQGLLEDGYAFVAFADYEIYVTEYDDTISAQLYSLR